MTTKPPRWRIGRNTPDGETPRPSVSGIQSRLQEFAARLTGEHQTVARDSGGAARTFVLRPHPGSGSWQQPMPGSSITWHGGQSSAARMTIRMMEVGDEVLLLNDDRRRALVGMARVVRAAYPAPTSEEPSRLAIDLEPIRHVSPPVALTRLRTEPSLHETALLRAPTPELVRLSADQRRILKRHGVS